MQRFQTIWLEDYANTRAWTKIFINDLEPRSKILETKYQKI